MQMEAYTVHESSWVRPGAGTFELASIGDGRYRVSVTPFEHNPDNRTVAIGEVRRCGVTYRKGWKAYWRGKAQGGEVEGVTFKTRGNAVNLLYDYWVIRGRQMEGYEV